MERPKALRPSNQSSVPHFPLCGPFLFFCLIHHRIHTRRSMPSQGMGGLRWLGGGGGARSPLERPRPCVPSNQSFASHFPLCDPFLSLMGPFSCLIHQRTHTRGGVCPVKGWVLGGARTSIWEGPAPGGASIHPSGVRQPPLCLPTTHSLTGHALPRVCVRWRMRDRPHAGERPHKGGV